MRRCWLHWREVHRPFFQLTWFADGIDDQLACIRTEATHVVRLDEALTALFEDEFEQLLSLDTAWRRG